MESTINTNWNIIIILTLFSQKFSIILRARFFYESKSQLIKESYILITLAFQWGGMT